MRQGIETKLEQKYEQSFQAYVQQVDQKTQQVINQMIHRFDQSNTLLSKRLRMVPNSITMGVQLHLEGNLQPHG